MPTPSIRTTTRVQTRRASPPGTGSAITQATTARWPKERGPPSLMTGHERPHYLPRTRNARHRTGCRHADTFDRTAPKVQTWRASPPARARRPSRRWQRSLAQGDRPAITDDGPRTPSVAALDGTVGGVSACRHLQSCRCCVSRDACCTAYSTSRRTQTVRLSVGSSPWRSCPQHRTARTVQLDTHLFPARARRSGNDHSGRTLKERACHSPMTGLDLPHCLPLTQTPSIRPGVGMPTLPSATPRVRARRASLRLRDYATDDSVLRLKERGPPSPMTGHERSPRLSLRP